jgi:hypothetical protein
MYMYGRGEKSSFFPESGACSGGLLWKVHCVALESEAPGVAAVLGVVLGLAEIAQASWQLRWAAW